MTKYETASQARKIRQAPSIRRWRASAYSIIEVMAAVGVIGIVFVSLFAGFSFGFGQIGRLRENLRATQVLTEKMETIRLYNWDQIKTPGFIPTSFQASLNPTNNSDTAFYKGTLTITNAPLTETYSSNLLQVTVDLAWQSGSVNCHRQMKSLISRYGIQNYVY